MTQALHTLLEHAEHQRDEALATLQQAEEATRRLREQSAQLHTYRDEYRQRNPAGGGRSTSIDILRTHQNFMQRLDQALAQLQGQIEAAESRSTRLRGELLARETRVASVRKLLERRGQETQRVTARQDQRRSDDAASSPVWRSSTSVLPALL
ncbi:MAG: flagellar export protein FliJ [Rubrivivax sp.]|nr:flagellar export protein FliJ [Rubrivivax sp.]